MNNRSATLGKELLERRFKNRKIELNESSLMKVIKKLGYKTVTDFYDAIADESLDINNVITEYEGLDKKIPDAAEIRSAEEFQLMTAADDDSTSSDVLVIGDDIKGINYRLPKAATHVLIAPMRQTYARNIPTDSSQQGGRANSDSSSAQRYALSGTTTSA